MRSAVIATVTAILVALALESAGGMLSTIDACDAERLGSFHGPLTTIYRVEKGNLSGVCHGTDDPAVYEAWAKLTVFTTAAERSTLAGFAGFRPGPDTEAAAFSLTLDPSQTRFLIAVNLEFLDEQPRYVQRVMGHEFAHVLTGTAEGVDRADPDCRFSENRYGCTTNSNYLSQWVERFWSPDELETLEGAGYRDPAGATRRCAADPGFPTRYAATNPSEDFAESFEFFLFGNRVATPVQPRIRFLATFPELVRMRDRIVAAGLADTRRFVHECS